MREAIGGIEVAPGGVGDPLRDAWISRPMRGKLMRDPDVRGINDSVHVVNKTIHPIGVAQGGTEPERVLAHARDIP
ncbi:MAG: hypothetical protein IRY94_12145 [Rhodospirillaceae bacterium]|nr:hypothetical protein [Rhodospirillaceae bacterium]